MNSTHRGFALTHDYPCKLIGGWMINGCLLTPTREETADGLQQAVAELGADVKSGSVLVTREKEHVLYQITPEPTRPGSRESLVRIIQVFRIPRAELHLSRLRGTTIQ
jgi:hypothetical protein